MTIISREKVRNAVARAMLKAPEAGEAGAIESVAARFALPPEAVREALEPVEEPSC